MGKNILTPEVPATLPVSGVQKEAQGPSSVQLASGTNGSGKVRKPPVDKKKAVFYVLLAAVIVIIFLPLMVVIHELGHTVAIYALGGEVTGYHYGPDGASVSYTGIEDERDLFIVHLSGVLANVLVGGYMLFHVWRFKGHPFQEALTLIWGIVLTLADFVTYTISDVLHDHGGDFDKIYDAYPWSLPVFLLLDLLLVVGILRVLTTDKFWEGIQLPRKKV